MGCELCEVLVFVGWMENNFDATCSSLEFILTIWQSEETVCCVQGD